MGINKDYLKGISREKLIIAYENTMEFIIKKELYIELLDWVRQEGEKE